MALLNIPSQSGVVAKTDAYCHACYTRLVWLVVEQNQGFCPLCNQPKVTRSICMNCGKPITIGQKIGWNKRGRTGNLVWHIKCHQVTTPQPTPPQPPPPQPPPPPPPPIAPTMPVVKPQAPANTLKAPFDRLDLSRYHKQTKRICERLSMGWYPLLYGSPGAGKTTLFHNMSQDLGMEFTLISCSKDMFRTEIMGSKNPLSRDYQESAFRNSWENGNSIVLFDEVGLAPGSFLNVLNSGLAQGLILYPDLKRIYKHKTCYIAFADNSNLWGDDSRFPEREDAGSAFRDRIKYIRFEYDLDLERKICMEKCPAFALDICAAIQETRIILENMQVPLFASPRVSYALADGLEHGLDVREILEETLWQGLPSATINGAQAEVIAIFRRKDLL